jgi:hypothetical protein
MRTATSSASMDCIPPTTMRTNQKMMYHCSLMKTKRKMIYIQKTKTQRTRVAQTFSLVRRSTRKKRSKRMWRTRWRSMRRTIFDNILKRRTNSFRMRKPKWRRKKTKPKDKNIKSICGASRPLSSKTLEIETASFIYPQELVRLEFPFAPCTITYANSEQQKRLSFWPIPFNWSNSRPKPLK